MYEKLEGDLMSSSVSLRELGHALVVQADGLEERALDPAVNVAQRVFV